MNLAHMTIIGNLTSDPKLFRGEDGGAPRARISVAVNEKRGEQEVTHFFDVTAFGELAENAVSSLAKGQRVIIVGRLGSYQEQQSAEDGKIVQRTRVGLTAIAIGPDLFRQFARVGKVASSNGPSRASKAREQEGPSPVLATEEEF